MNSQTINCLAFSFRLVNNIETWNPKLTDPKNVHALRYHGNGNMSILLKYVSNLQVQHEYMPLGNNVLS
jgi:hypothetical protein